MTTPLTPSTRSCGDCTMCCKLLRIEVLNKPALEWCTHCSTRKGCDIYETRPEPCRTFHCGYITHAGFGEEWKPTTARMMIVTRFDHIFFHVDPIRPDAWKQKPYYQQLKSLARSNNANGTHIIVRIKNRFIVVVPERDIDLGEIDDNETIGFNLTQTPQGPVTHVIVSKQNGEETTTRVF